MTPSCPPIACWLAAGAGAAGRPEALERSVGKRLRSLLRFACRQSPYYRALFDRLQLDWRAFRGPEDLVRLPVLDKATLMAQMPELLASPSRGARFARRTTGTTGIPLQLPVTGLERWFDLYAWQRVYRRAGLGLRDRQLKMIIPAGPFPEHRVSSALGLFPRAYLSTLEPAAKKVSFIKRLAPRAIFGHASFLGEVALELERRGERLLIPRIFSTSDMLWPGLRQRIEERLGGEVFDVYGAVETGPVAWECREHDGFHVHSGLVIVEIVDDDGHPAPQGRVVCTVLWRRAVPLIRYALGDWAEWAKDACPCGDARPRLAALHGREHELLRLPDGEWVSASNLVSALLGIPGIRQFQVVQETERQIAYRLVTAPDYPAWGDQRLVAQFQARFMDRLNPVVAHVKQIEQVPGAKFTPFISLRRSRAAGEGPPL